MPETRAPDGTSLVYDAYEVTEPRAAVLWVCGWSDHRTRWRVPAERLRDAGYAVFVLDQRGQGDSGGGRGHLSRFSQLLGDLQAFRREVRRRTGAPQVLLGHSFGGLVVLRYLETQPDNPVRAAILSAPWLATAVAPPVWKLLLGTVLTDLWPSVAVPIGLDTDQLCRDPAVCRAYAANPAVHGVMTPGAWSEIRWAQRAVPADSCRIDIPVLFVIPGTDRIADSEVTRAFADGLKAPVHISGFAEMYHEALIDPEGAKVVAALVSYLDGVVPATNEVPRP